MRNLQKISDEHKIVVVVTNKVVANFDGKSPSQPEEETTFSITKYGIEDLQ